MTINAEKSTYPSFEQYQIIEVRFLGKTIIGKFLKWKHKEDRPFGCFLYIEQDYENYMNGLKEDLDLKNISLQDFDALSYEYEIHKNRSLNDQYITKINDDKFKCTPQ